MTCTQTVVDLSVLNLYTSEPQELKASKRKSVSFSRQLEKVRYFRREDPAINIRTQQEVMKDSNPIHSIRSPACRFRTMHEISQRVERESVAMDNLCLKYPFLEGYVFVKNICFHKRVVVRYTTDNWTTWTEVECRFESSNPFSNFDRFMFSLDATRFFNLSSPSSTPTPTPIPTSFLVFAIRYECEGQTFWDNNGGENYRVDFITQAPAPAPAIPASPIPLPVLPLTPAISHSSRTSPNSEISFSPQPVDKLPFAKPTTRPTNGGIPLNEAKIEMIDAPISLKDPWEKLALAELADYTAGRYTERVGFPKGISKISSSYLSNVSALSVSY